MILDPAELVTLTRKHRAGAQGRVLRAMGIEHRTRPDGSLAVSRAHVEAVLGGGVAKKQNAKEWVLGPVN